MVRTGTCLNKLTGEISGILDAIYRLCAFSGIRLQTPGRNSRWRLASNSKRLTHAELTGKTNKDPSKRKRQCPGEASLVSLRGLDHPLHQGGKLLKVSGCR